MFGDSLNSALVLNDFQTGMVGILFQLNIIIKIIEAILYFKNNFMVNMVLHLRYILIFIIIFCCICM